MTDSGESGHFICPGHGPMARVYALGVLRLIQCSTCGKQPIDFLEKRHVSGGPVGGSDA